MRIAVVTDPSEIEECFGCLAHLQATYPAFSQWFHKKVVPGLGNGTRNILSASTDKEILGIAIAKRTEVEQKLCTLWVADHYRNHGVGIRLMREAMIWLGTERPTASAPESASDIHRLLAKLGFTVTSTRKIPGNDLVQEIFYNEPHP